MTALQKVRRLFIVLIVLLAVLDLGLIVYLRWPGTSSAGRKEREAQYGLELQQKKAAEVPLHGIDKKLIDDRVQVQKLYKNVVPNRWSEISAEIDKLAQQNGILAQNTRYITKDTGLPDVQRISVQTSITGDYAKLARFMNSLERDKLLFLITEVSLSGQEGGTVQLQLKFDTFLKETA